MVSDEKFSMEINKLLENQRKLLRNQRASRKTGWTGDVRGILSIIALVGTFILGGTQLALTGSAEVPTWTAGIAGSVIGFYFGGRSEESRSAGAAESEKHEHTYTRSGPDVDRQTEPGRQ